jgi:hypothetical protein
MSTEFIVHLEIDPDRDLRDLEQASANLRSELSRLDGIASVEPLPIGEAPAGSRAADAVSVGSILMTLAASGGVISSLIGVLREWAGRDEKRKVVLQIGEDKIELAGVRAQDEKQLVETFLSSLRTRKDKPG